MSDKQSIKVGDTVKINDSRRSMIPTNRGQHFSGIGRVVEVVGGSIGVCFDDDMNGHDLGGKCRYGHGWIVPKNALSVISVVYKVEVGDLL